MEFKQDAARLVLEKGYTHQKAADNLQISLSAIGRWVRAERGSTTDGETKEVVLNLADEAELVRLRRENEQLRMERLIIKKTAGDSMNISNDSYRLNNIRVKRADTSVAWINSIFLVMNLLILVRFFICKEFGLRVPANLSQTRISTFGSA